MIIGMLLVKNEANRYLEKVLKQLNQICNLVISVDDCSTDNTVELLNKYNCKVYSLKESTFEKDELFLRKLNWELALNHANDGDWILHVDADEIFEELNFYEKIKIAENKNFDCLVSRLYDMWSDTHYRDDDIWKSSHNYFPVLVKYKKDFNYIWREQKIHCGPFPVNAFENPLYSEIDILHYGWSKKEDRKRKYEFYKKIDKELIGNKEQYESILDENPNLKLYGRKKIMIGCPVRQDEETFKRYLESLESLNTEGYEVDFYFILHNSPNLKKYLNENQYEEYQSNNEYIKNDTHVWQEGNLKDVIVMKNKLLERIIKYKYDYFFLVDSDILLQKETLIHLLNQKKDIIAEIFWTKWNTDTEEQPNAWTHDFYSFDDLNKLNEWRKKGVFEVGGTGACILIKKEVIKKGVNYYPIKNISYTLWEDRAFCIKAIVNGFRIYLDTNYPAIHLYR